MNRRLLVVAVALNLVAGAAAFAQPYQGQGGPPPDQGYDGPQQGQYGPPQQGQYGRPPRDGYGGPPPPGQYGPPPPDFQGGSRHWERHVRRCFAQHDNYDPRSNTYLNSRGHRRTCH